MAFQVSDPETETLVREYAQRKRVGIDEAIKLAVTKAREVDDRTRDEKLAKIDAILAEVDSWPRTGLKADKEFFDMINGD